MAKEKQIAGLDIDALQTRLGYCFSDHALLERAVTHRSWAHEQVSPGEEEKARRLHNEALEFVGDSVVGLIVSEHLFHLHPDSTEGELSRMKHRLVSTTMFAKAAVRIGLGEFLRFGRGEERTGGSRKRALLADVFEAVIAAIYMDSGFPAAKEFLHRALGPELEEADPESAAAADYKTMLQELLQGEKQVAPQYTVVETLGPPHRRVFHVEVAWVGGCVRGEGRTIKAAEVRAAERALAQINTVAAKAGD